MIATHALHLFEIRERTGNVTRYQTLTEVREVKAGPIPLADLARENRG